jgi:hypothetical protein
MGSEAVREAVSRAFGLGCLSGAAIMAVALILAYVVVEGTRRKGR